MNQVKDLKDILESARAKIDFYREPLYEAVQIRDLLKTINSDETFMKDQVDEVFKTFFYEEFTSAILRRLIRENPRDSTYLSAIAEIFEQYIILFVNQLKKEEYSLPFIEAIRYLFEWNCLLHCYNYLIPVEKLKKLGTQNQQWRNNIEIGSMIDAFIDEAGNYSSGWSQGKITQIYGDILHVEFIFDHFNTDKNFDRWSVEIAQHESKTKESWEWRKSLVVGSQVDAYDKSQWIKSTILEFQEQELVQERVVKMAFIGFRVYCDSGLKSDERGKYEGWSSKFDEYISVYSPKIQPLFSKTMKSMSINELGIDDSSDSMIPPDQGFDKVFAVPRLRKCISSLMIRLINLTGNMGGYELIEQIISKQIKLGDQMDINLVSSLAIIVGLPYLLYHKEFIQDYGKRISEMCVYAVRNAPDKIKDLKKDTMENLLKTIDNIYRRTLSSEQREQQSEILKLEIALKNMKSSQLDRRISGIKDLNDIVNTLKYQSNSSTAGIISWMQENDVFNFLFDARRTHIQLVQRSGDILKLLLQEDKFTKELMEQFWSLSKGDYKFEIYKLINDSTFYFKNEHNDFLAEQFKSIPADQLGVEELQCLSELGSYSKSEEFKKKIAKFLWNIICNSEEYKEELIQNCISKFCDLVRYWNISIKHEYFQELALVLQQTICSVPVFKLFRVLIYEQSERTTYNYIYNADGSTVADLTLSQSIDNLVENNLIGVAIENLKLYCIEAHKIKLNNQTLTEQSDRNKLYLTSQKYSHHQEIDERLKFLQQIAQISTTFTISKIELEILYELLALQPIIQTDLDEFLIWCKNCCQKTSSNKQVLDINDVGEFFTEKMNSGSLDVKNLKVVVFDFLQHYFVSINEKDGKLIKIVKPVTYETKTYSYIIGKGYVLNQQPKQEEPKVLFKILQPTNTLNQIEIVWNIALNCQNEKVIPKALDFLIQVYYNLDSSIQNDQITLQNEIVKKCMDILQSNQSDEILVKRVIRILKRIIAETEKKGTEVKPHLALLKGEFLENLKVIDNASPRKQTIVIQIYSNATLWELKKLISEKLGLAPKYLILVKGFQLSDIMNGQTLSQLGFSQGDSIFANKRTIQEDIPQVPLLGKDRKFTEKSRQVFNEMFDLYCDENGQMTRELCALFISGATGNKTSPHDLQVSDFIRKYDNNNDGKIERQEFLNFYEVSCLNNSEVVRQNLKRHNIRVDLKKLSEVQEESNWAIENMPRYFISKEQEYFNILLSLLDKPSPISESAWDLIQMLATNQSLYKKVLTFRTSFDSNKGNVNWQKFFDTNSIFKLLYTLQIVEAVMEEGEGEGKESLSILENGEKKLLQQTSLNLVKNVSITSSEIETPNLSLNKAMSSISAKRDSSKLESDAPKLARKSSQLEESTLRRKSSIVDQDQEYITLRREWTQNFLKQDGFSYILNVFMSKEINTIENSPQQNFELKHQAFLLKLLRIFIMAAFTANQLEQENYLSAGLQRRSSLINEIDPQQQQQQENEDNSRFDQLKRILEGEQGETIINSINYKLLQNKILNIISQILSKDVIIFDERLIIENALSLWVGCVLHKPELLQEFYEFKSNSLNCDQFILNGILICNSENVREEFKQSLTYISKSLLANSKVQQPVLYLLKLLSSQLDNIDKYQNKQYIQLINELVNIFYRGTFTHKTISSQDFDLCNLLQHSISKIKQFILLCNTQNESINIQEVEATFEGLLQLAANIINNLDSFQRDDLQFIYDDLIFEVFQKFLFVSVFQKDQTQDDEIKTIKTGKQANSNQKIQFGKTCKDAAYKLLNILTKKSPQIMNNFLENQMIPLMNLIKRQKGWEYEPKGQSEKKQQYVGLINQGATCYMNSMNQQQFMIPAYRYNLLSVDDNVPDKLVDYKDYKVDDNMLHQFQKLFANLELSDRDCYDSIDYCFSFKVDGQPTVLHEQKDALEYLNLSFDKIEYSLKNTSRKYLAQSIFGGQTCSQMVCQECGKCNNRIEDFYNLSLTVKDIQGMQESLSALVKGEVINDYQCDGCKKKVDVSRRTLISKTPSVLIVHLQRIIFDFNTYQNEKINNYFEFPNQLDLKPYSYYEIMKKENRINKQDGEGDEKMEEESFDKDKQKKEEENIEPEEENCFEYKLVGIVMHSGQASSGHYWSYINTRRGDEELDENDPNWAKSEQDPWLEFNDRYISEFNPDKIKEECFGGDGKKQNNALASDSTYGQSAYMLFYEKRIKNPIKIVCEKPAENEEQSKDIIFDDKKNEYYKLVDYKTSVLEIQPNSIYKSIFADNKKFEFEQEILSEEFFNFAQGNLDAIILLNQFKLDDEQDLIDKVINNTIRVGRKIGFELLGKLKYNMAIDKYTDDITRIMKLRPQYCEEFFRQCFTEDNCEYILQLLLESPNWKSRVNLGYLLKSILDDLKKYEEDYLYQTYAEQIEIEGNVVEVEQEKSYTAKFIKLVLSQMNTYVAKNWYRMDHLFDMLCYFGIGNERQNIEQLPPGQLYDEQKLIGMHFLFQNKFIEKACDFILQNQSPLLKEGERRFEMGGSVNKPEFTNLMKLVLQMILTRQLIDVYELSFIEKQMLLHKKMLKIMLNSGQDAGLIGQILATISKDDEVLSQRIAKVLLKEINRSDSQSAKKLFETLRPFLKQNDSLKQQKLEWILGVSQTVNKKDYRFEKYKYGVELLEKIGDESTNFFSPILTGYEEPLFGKLLKFKGRNDAMCILSLKEILSLVSEDDQIAQFVYNTPAPTYQHAHYSDWFRSYLLGQKLDIERMVSAFSYNKSKYDDILESLPVLKEFEEKLEVFKLRDKEAITLTRQEGKLEEQKDDWLVFDSDEVYTHFPPQYVIGKQSQFDSQILCFDEDKNVRVTIDEIICEYNWSNPQGLFNLSLPHIEYRTPSYQSWNYYEYKRNIFKQQYKEQKENEQKLKANADLDSDENKEDKMQFEDELFNQDEKYFDEFFPAPLVRNWFENKKEDAILLKVNVINKISKQVNVTVKLSSDSTNVKIPQSAITKSLYGNETKLLIHLEKINPKEGWGNITVNVQSKVKEIIQMSQWNQGSVIYSSVPIITLPSSTRYVDRIQPENENYYWPDDEESTPKNYSASYY